MTQTFIGTLATIDCCNCGMTFGMTSDYRQRRLDDGELFYCPAGHSQHFSESTVKRLEKEIERVKRNEQWEREAKERAFHREKVLTHRMAAHKGVAKRMKNRIANGVCPCCNRSFQNLKGHMHTQHPNWKTAE